MRPATRSAVVPEPLSDAYLQQCEFEARRFSGAYTGTAGTLAAHVMRLLAEVRALRDHKQYQHEQIALLAAKYEELA